MSVQVCPLSLLSCHCTVGVGLPPAAAVNRTVWPASTVWFNGSVVTTGAVWVPWVPLCATNTLCSPVAVRLLGAAGGVVADDQMSVMGGAVALDPAYDRPYMSSTVRST